MLDKKLFILTSSQLIIAIVFLAVAIQDYLTFFSGNTFIIPFMGAGFSVPRFVLPLVLFFWVISLFGKTRSSSIIPGRIPLSLIILYVIFCVFFVVSIYRGWDARYPALLSYTEMFFWTLVLINVSWFGHLSSRQFHNVAQVILIPVTVLALFALPNLVLNNFFGIKLPYSAYIDPDVNYSLVFCAIAYFNRVLIFRSRRTSDRIAFTIIFLTLLLMFSKPVTFTLLFALAAVLIIVRNSIPIIARILLYLIPVLALFVLLQIMNVLPSSVNEFFLSQISQRWLHTDQGRGAVGVLGGRDIIWDLTLDMIIEKPLQGYGMGFRLPYKLSDAIYAEVSVHNLYIYMILAFGVPGGVVSILTIFQYLFLVARAIRQKMLFRDETVLTMFGFIVAGFAFNLVGLIGVSIGFYTIFAVCVGALLSIVLQPRLNSIGNV